MADRESIMKVRYYNPNQTTIWCILESDIATPNWTIIDCWNKACIGMRYKDMNEFKQIHLSFVEDLLYYNPLPVPPSNAIQKAYWDFHDHIYDLKPEKVTPYHPSCKHEFKLYVGMVETFEYCINCDMKRKVS